METDILVSGGGIAGLTATATFASAGFHTICVEPKAPVETESDPGADLRSTAFLEPSLDLFREADLWDRLAPYSTDLAVMRLADAGGVENEIRQVQDFEADGLKHKRFGANLPNWLLHRELNAHLAEDPNAEVLTGLSVTRHTSRTSGAIVSLSDGQQVRARLVVAADGRESFLREAAGIGVKRIQYGQKALVFAVSHTVAHDHVSTEIHRTGGPFTLVPLPDRNGVPHSSVVWMERNSDADALLAMDVTSFETQLNSRSCGVLGALKLATARGAWPIISQIADRLTGPRLALIAEAAHVIPPIGAQGLNMSLKDIRVLRDLVAAAASAGQDIGGPVLLDRYGRTRHAEIAATIAGVDLLNRAAMAETQSLRDLRNFGLKALAETPLKTVVMKMGLG